jgi:TolB protein
MRKSTVVTGSVLGISLLLMTCLFSQQPAVQVTVPYQERWGIYSLDPDMQNVELLYSSSQRISNLRLNHVGDKFVFSQPVGGDDNAREEIFTLGIDGQNLQQLTDNSFWDLYPAWSSDDTRIAFLSMQGTNLDIYVMNADGSNQTRLFDSGFHDADIHWTGHQITFTADNRIWIMNDDGSDAHSISEPPRAGEWGNANLPFGDYDPRISPDGRRIVFERLVDDQSSHGNYDLYRMNIDGSNLTRLTNNGYSQGLANWSHSGDRIVYTVAAIGDEGKYDIYMMKFDGTENRNITPETFPENFLCHSPTFSLDDSTIYFVGEWWQ